MIASLFPDMSRIEYPFPPKEQKEPNIASLSLQPQFELQEFGADSCS